MLVRFALVCLGLLLVLTALSSAQPPTITVYTGCLLYTSDAADE